MAKIMVIDDEKTVCNLFKDILEPEGYIVLTDMNPLSALKTIKKEKPDCVLLDIRMREMGGIDVLKKIKSFKKDIAVIIMTAYGNIETAMQSIKLGAYDYITKPFDIEAVKGLIHQSLVNPNKKE